MTEQPWSLVFLAGFAVYVGIRHVYSERVKGVETDVRRIDATEKTLLAIVMLGSLLLPMLYIASPWLQFADYRLPAPAPWVGAAVMVGALWLFWRSHRDLGTNWSISLELRKDHRLIEHGVYRRIRHPMYAAIWSWSLAQGLLLPNWLGGWSAAATLAPLYFIRVPREEALMRERFGDAYRAYMARTGRLWPRLRRSRGAPGA